MKRVFTAAILAALILPGGLRAQEAEAEDPGEESAVEDPESSSAEVVPPTPAAPQGGKDQVAETYTVKSGDTLWDLSQRFLGNAWYWPKVWSYNPEIENPHWIYPGNLVRFYPSADELPAMVEGPEADDDAAPMAPQDLDDVSSGNLTAPDLMGQDDDVVAVSPGVKIGYTPKAQGVMRQDGLVTQRELDEAGVIDRAFAEREMLSLYDKVYLKFKNRAAVRLGERYSIFRTVTEVRHPVSGNTYGHLTHVLGSLRVVAIDQGVATGIIEQSFDDIHRGDFVAPQGNFQKRILAKENTRQMQGVILASMNPGLPFMGEQHVVFVDKGSRDGVEEGNTFNVIRRGDPLDREMTAQAAKSYPAEDVATILIFDVKDNAAAGLVVRSIRELTIGDTVVMRPAATQASATP